MRGVEPHRRRILGVTLGKARGVRYEDLTHSSAGGEELRPHKGNMFFEIPPFNAFRCAHRLLLVGVGDKVTWTHFAAGPAGHLEQVGWVQFFQLKMKLVTGLMSFGCTS